MKTVKYSRSLVEVAISTIDPNCRYWLCDDGNVWFFGIRTKGGVNNGPLPEFLTDVMPRIRARLVYYDRPDYS